MIKKQKSLTNIIKILSFLGFINNNPKLIKKYFKKMIILIKFIIKNVK